MYSKYFILLIWTFICFSFTSSAPTVNITDGSVKGFSVHVNVNDAIKVVNAFQGIPYATPPIGDLRFKKPEPVKSWTGTLEAINKRSGCMQINYDVVNEDCLYLNIWTPSLSFPTNDKRPVMFWIHGGAYITGTIFEEGYNGTMIAARGDVVIVSVNYRLGAFGFLYDGTNEAPGNMGLHDMVLALKWVKKNIAHFGGDPEMVTIFGESAGSMAVGSLILMTSVGNLFKRAILESGSPNSFLGSESRHSAMIKAKELAKEFECLKNNQTINTSCLRSIDAMKLVTYVDKSKLNGVFYAPIYGDELMPIKPALALKTGKFRNNIDIIFGVVNDEGSGFVVDIFVDLKPGPEHKMTIGKANLFIQLIFTAMKLSYGKVVADFYTSQLKEGTDNEVLKKIVAKSFGDFHLTCPTILFGSSYAKWNKLNHAYSYDLTYTQRKSSDWTGVRHGEDNHLVFGRPLYYPQQYSQNEVQMSKDYIDAWTLFAKTGTVPKLGNVTWTEAIDHKLPNPLVRYMALDPQNYHIVENGYKTTCEGFWETYLAEDLKFVSLFPMEKLKNLVQFLA